MGPSQMHKAGPFSCLVPPQDFSSKSHSCPGNVGAVGRGSGVQYPP